jgi:hypothetical protein
MLYGSLLAPLMATVAKECGITFFVSECASEHCVGADVQRVRKYVGLWFARPIEAHCYRDGLCLV